MRSFCECHAERCRSLDGFAVFFKGVLVNVMVALASEYLFSGGGVEQRIRFGLHFGRRGAHFQNVNGIGWLFYIMSLWLVMA